MDRAFGLDLEPAARGYDEHPASHRATFSPVFLSGKSLADTTTHQQLGNTGFGPITTHATGGSCGAKEQLVASTSSPFILETPSGYSSVNGNGSIGLSTSSELISRDSDRVDMWGDGVFIPFDLHLSPVQQHVHHAQQHQRSQYHSLYSPMTRPQTGSHQAMPNCVEPLGATDFRDLSSIDDSNGDEVYQNDVASALSSLLEDDDKFSSRQSSASGSAPREESMAGTAFTDRNDGLPERISVSVKPPPQQPRPWDQYSSDPVLSNNEADPAFNSIMEPTKGECSLLSAEKKVLASTNDTRVFSSGDSCPTPKFDSRSLSCSYNTAACREPISFYAQPLLPGTPDAGRAAAAPFSAAMGPASLGMRSDTMSPLRQYSLNVPDRRPECSQQFLSFQSARQQQQTHGSMSSPAGHYGVRQPVAPSSTAQAEQWRRQLMLKRSNVAALYSSASSPFGGAAFATATSTPPATSGASSISHAASLLVSYQSPANKRARMAPSLFVGYGSQSCEGSSHRLVPPAPIPLQNGVDGVRSSPFAMPSVSRAPPASLWQGVSRPAFAPLGFPAAGHGLRHPPQPFAPPPPRQIGIYSPQERRARIQRFLEKRKQRVFHKRIKYDCRKRLASACPRIKGRFVRRDEYLAAVERGQRVTHPHAADVAEGPATSP